jgi:succinoglycan biosynthesis protein ExoL
MPPLKILSVLQLLGHPRDSKRIAMLKQAGFEVEAAAFERDYHSGRLPDCPVETLGKISHGQYFKRLLKLPSVFLKLRRAMKRNQIVYASGQDMALMSLVSGVGLKRPVIVEVGDVREVLTADGIKGKIARTIEKWAIGACKLIVVTAPSFYNIYYRQWLKTSTPGLVIENKLENAFVNEVQSNGVSAPAGKPFVDRPFRIGYYGLLRDKWSWDVLESLAVNIPGKIEIVLAGLPMDPMLEIPKLVEQHANIEYRGEYKSPDDLPSLYNSVDMVWVCYPPIREDDWNLKWARPNRFYQSCLFQKPTFTRSGCQDAVDVEKYEIGMIVEEVDVEKASTAIQQITPNDLETWGKNMQNLPLGVYSYTNEVEELKSNIISIAQDRGLQVSD